MRAHFALANVEPRTSIAVLFANHAVGRNLCDRTLVNRCMSILGALYTSSCLQQISRDG